MNQSEVAVCMRVQELEKRVARRKVLIAQIKNELALKDEPLSADDRKFHEHALRALRDMNCAYKAETEMGYWKTLWLAIQGKW